MFEGIGSFARLLLGTTRDLAPIVIVVAFFQLVVLRQPFPDLGQMVAGLVLVMLGLGLFMRGLDLALFPVGEALADAFARKGSVFWLLLFAFALGFGTTVAEPALIAVCDEAAKVMAGAGELADDLQSRDRYARALRYTVALSVGSAIVLGVLRILRGWPIHRLIIGGYAIVVVQTMYAPKMIIPLAYDSGGVTTSTVTVPLVTALGLGLASTVPGRSALLDGFGLIALASLFPIITVMGYAQLSVWKSQRAEQARAKEQ